MLSFKDKNLWQRLNSLANLLAKKKAAFILKMCKFKQKIPRNFVIVGEH